MISFENYLHKSGHTNSTIKSYLFANKIFLAKNPMPDLFTYKNVVHYFNSISVNYKNENTKIYLLNGVKKYYDYLVDVGLRDNHPCKNFNILNKRRKDIIHQDLFSTKELEALLNREERYEMLKQKNKVLISLLIFQGLNSGELPRIKVKHVDLDNGLIFIKSSKKIGQRHLEIHPKQYHLFDNYINKDRKKLLTIETDNLLIGKLGKPNTTDDIQYIISTLKPLYPDRNLNPTTIRQSVIANWLNEKKLPLEQVQIMSGQKWISTTLKYRQASLEQQRELINKWFPL
ncbi:MAG: site-specific integrase [Bacteroidota bacterium]|nr:site-specific integrase [Bacteroidota bacterium]MDP3145994.1 site-specific integrase [Bacteroidota bacterium]